MATGLVQAVMERRRRDQAAKDAAMEAEGSEDCDVGDERHPQGNRPGVPPLQVGTASGTSDPAGGGTLAVQISPRDQHTPKHLGHVGHKTILLHKDRLTERLILEEAMMWRLPRCGLFLLQFGLFLSMLWVSYPATSVLPVYQTLWDGLSVDDKMPPDVHTLEDLKTYISGLASNWRSFSPGSITYAEDPMARSYLGSVTAFPPKVSYPDTLKPTLGDEFTVTAWVKTDVRFNTIMKTVQESRSNAICWQFDLERIVYGEHESSTAEEVVHPWAEAMYEEGVTADEVWKKSTFRANFSDSKWHHVAVLVQASQVGFVYDGSIIGYKTLSRAITDCSGATFTVGSDDKTGYLVDIKYIPRLLTEVELSFLRTKGKLLDDMLAGGGTSISSETNQEALVRLASEGQTHTTTKVATLTTWLTSTLRALASTIKDMVESSDDSTEAIGTSITDAMSSQHDSLLQSVLAPVTVMSNLIQALDETASETRNTILQKLVETSNEVSETYYLLEEVKEVVDDTNEKVTDEEVTGTMTLSVSDPQTFVDSDTASTAVKTAISDTTGAPTSWISLTLSIVGARRLGEDAEVQHFSWLPEAVGRHLQAGGVVAVSYTITIPASTEYTTITGSAVQNSMGFQSGSSTATTFANSIATSTGQTITVRSNAGASAGTGSGNIAGSGNSTSSNDSTADDSTADDSTADDSTADDSTADDSTADDSSNSTGSDNTGTDSSGEESDSTTDDTSGNTTDDSSDDASDDASDDTSDSSTDSSTDSGIDSSTGSSTGDSTDSSTNSSTNDSTNSSTGNVNSTSNNTGLPNPPPSRLLSDKAQGWTRSMPKMLPASPAHKEDVEVTEANLDAIGRTLSTYKVEPEEQLRLRQEKAEAGQEQEEEEKQPEQDWQEQQLQRRQQQQQQQQWSSTARSLRAQTLSSSDEFITVPSCTDADGCWYTRLATAVASISVLPSYYLTDHAAGQWLACMIDNKLYTHWTKEMLEADDADVVAAMEAGERHPLMHPTDTTCDIISGCIDDPDWTDDYGQTCKDYAEIRTSGDVEGALCEDGGTGSFSKVTGVNFDQKALRNCCVCGKSNPVSSCTDTPDWKGSSGAICNFFDTGTWEKDALDCSENWDEDSTETSNYEACCVCESNTVYEVNMSKWTYSDKEYYTDNYGYQCYAYEYWGICNSSGAFNEANFQDNYDSDDTPEPSKDSGYDSGDSSSEDSDDDDDEEDGAQIEGQDQQPLGRRLGGKRPSRKTRRLQGYPPSVTQPLVDPRRLQLPPSSSTSSSTTTPAPLDTALVLDPNYDGFTAWDACVACGGGDATWDYANVTAWVKVLFPVLLSSGDFYLCNNDLVKDDMYSYCPATCAYCNMDSAPDESDAQRALLECNDQVYEDWLGKDCSWYMLNDAASDTYDVCERYADTTTKASCLKTCETCPHTANIFDTFDSNSDGRLELIEFNQMCIATGNELQTPTSWLAFLRELCDATGDHTWECANQEQYPAPTKDVFTADGSPSQTIFNTLAKQMLSEMQSPSNYLPTDVEGLVLDFTSESIFEGSQNFQLQEEPPSTVFNSCNSHSDCTVNATTCGRLSNSNPICSRQYVVPTYCASACRTGGCGPGGGIMPGVSGDFCQPCDGCTLETDSAYECPSYCTGYTWDGASTTFDKAEEAAILDVEYREPLSTEELDLAGSFTLSAWVKSFDTQWIFEKQIYMPGLNSLNLGTFEAYNETTGMLTCWRMSPYGVEFRNRWSEAETTTVENPLSSTILASTDTWHFVVLLKSSYRDTSNMRRDQLTWMVDGAMSDPTTDALGELVWEVPEYGFPDCGGELLSVTQVTQETYAGPTDFFDNSLFPEWSSTWNNQSTGTIQARSMPLADGDNGMTVLSFRDITIPKGAEIKSANILICAARTFIDYLAYQQDSDCLPDTWATMTTNLKITGIKTSTTMALHSETDLCAITDATNSSQKASNEVDWTIKNSEWRASGIVQGPDTTTFDEPDSCYVSSPDLTDLVAELMDYLDENDGIRRDLNFVFADSEHSWAACGSSSIFQSASEQTAYEAELEQAEKEPTCNTHPTRNDFMMGKLPLWMESLADYEAGRSGAGKATLRIQYCMNKDCVSPSFLGAGPSAVNTEFGTMGDWWATTTTTTTTLTTTTTMTTTTITTTTTDSNETDSSSNETDENTTRRMEESSKISDWSLDDDFGSNSDQNSNSNSGWNLKSDSNSDSNSDSDPNWREEQAAPWGVKDRSPIFIASNSAGLFDARASLGIEGNIVKKHPRQLHPSPIPEGMKPGEGLERFLDLKKVKLPRSKSLKEQADTIARRKNATPPSIQLPHLARREEDRPAEERRLTSNIKCDYVTCKIVGGVLETGLATTGKLYAPKFIFRAMATSELQQSYYNYLPVVAPDGEDEIPGPEELVSKTEAEVAQYPKDVVSIIPPVIFQRRAKSVNCSSFVPSIADSLEAYFKNQVSGRCSTTYSCTRDTGFTCIDRSKYVDKSVLHYETKTVDMEGVSWYPEFLDMFSVPVIYREGDIMATEDWMDLQTTELSIVNVFLAPSLSAGTTLIIHFSYDGPGRLKGETTFRSFVQMNSDDRSAWAAMNWTIFALACLDILCILISFVANYRVRRKIFTEMPTMTDEQKDTVIIFTPVWSWLDIFDILFRGINIGFCIWHWNMYPAPETLSDGSSLGNYEAVVKDILDLEWSDPLVTTEDKVDNFMSLVLSLNESLQSEDFHRMMGKMLVLLFFMRVVIYMRVHPKIAVLYATIVEMYMDFVHFCVVFFALFAVLAYLGMWSFGDQKADFRDFGTAMYTEFRMLVGEFNMDTDEAAGFDVMWGLWCVTYFLMVFSLLLNFFLAIVVDSYANVKEAVQTCKVENDVVWDICTTFVYPVFALFEGLPQRGKILLALLRADLDQDNKNDDEGDQDIPVSAEMLDTFSIVKGKKQALAFVRYYHRVCPATDFHYQDGTSELEHKTLMRAEVALDSIRHAVLGEKILDNPSTAAEISLDTVHHDVKKDLMDVKTMLGEAEASRRTEMEGLLAKLGGPESVARRVARPSVGTAGVAVDDGFLVEMRAQAEQERSSMQRQLDTVMQLLEDSRRQEEQRRQEAREAQEELRRSREAQERLMHLVENLSQNQPHTPTDSGGPARPPPQDIFTSGEPAHLGNDLVQSAQAGAASSSPPPTAANTVSSSPKRALQPRMRR